MTCPPKTAGAEKVEADVATSSAKQGVYDAAGRKIADAADFSTLPAGFYIANGKKIIKK